MLELAACNVGVPLMEIRLCNGTYIGGIMLTAAPVSTKKFKIINLLLLSFTKNSRPILTSVPAVVVKPTVWLVRFPNY